MSRTILLALLLLALIGTGSSTVFLETDLEEQAEVEHVLAREAHFFLQRAYPFKAIPPDARLHALEQLDRQLELHALGVEEKRRWQSIGPEFVPNGEPIDFRDSPPIPVSGRATAIVIDPRNPERLFLGTAQGGVWRSIDSGASWQPITDDLPSLAVGALAVDPANPDTIFLGTGEANFSASSYYGAGLFKSTNGGNTWERAGQLPTRICVSHIVFEPGNSQTVYVATSFARTTSAKPIASTEGGIFKSADGGATWRKLLDGVATGLVINPSSPANLIAALGDPGGNDANGIYRSSNSGVTWQLIGNLPTGRETGRIELAQSPSSPNIILVSVSHVSTGGLRGIFKSEDGGGTWRMIDDPPDYCGRQCFFNNFIAFHPTNPSTIFLGGVPLFRSTDGGRTFANISSPQQFGPGLHADNHAMAFDPRDPTKIYVANDGGISRSSDMGNSWTPLNNGLSTFQFQSVAAHPTDGRRAIGGTQDNGTLLYTGTPAWRQVDVGDGGDIVIDPREPNMVYHFYFFLLFARSNNGGLNFSIRTDGLPVSETGFPTERALFYAPLAIDPVNPGTLYTGSTRIYRTTSRGEFWLPISGDLTRSTGAISAIAISPNQVGAIYAGTSDGNVMRTTDNGASWQQINTGLPNRFVTRLGIDPKMPQVVYATYSGFGTGHIYKSTNGGQSWTDVSGNLPDIPVNAIAIDTEAPDTIYLATDIGVFVSRTGGDGWIMIKEGLPSVAVFDLDLNRKTGVLIAATHGRGMFALPLDGKDDDTAPQVSVLSPAGGETFNPGQVVDIRWNAMDNSLVQSQDIELSLDGGATFGATIASGLGGEVRSFKWQVPELPTTRGRIRISSRDIAGNTGRGISAGDFSIVVQARPTIKRVEFKSGGKGKLIIDGDGLIIDDTVIEVGGRQLEVTKYPKKFRLPDGTQTRVQGQDGQLKQLIQTGQKVSITLLNRSTGGRSAPFDFNP